MREMSKITSELHAARCWNCGKAVEVNIHRYSGSVFQGLTDEERVPALLCETKIGGYLVETRNRDTLPHEGKVPHAETICWEWEDGVGRGNRLMVRLAPANSLFQHDLVVSRIRQFGCPMEPEEDWNLR